MILRPGHLTQIIKLVCPEFSRLVQVAKQEVIPWTEFCPGRRVEQILLLAAVTGGLPWAVMDFDDLSKNHYHAEGGRKRNWKAEIASVEC